MSRRIPLPRFATESDMVAKFCRDLADPSWRQPRRWTPYHETAGFDLLLVNKENGIQIGLEAKLVLNPKVVEQAIEGTQWRDEGPDYRGVLVPALATPGPMKTIARQIGLGVILVAETGSSFPRLPDEHEGHWFENDWHPWLPTRRCLLPEYVPDVIGGKPAPVQLTPWKIKAIKLLVLLERRGAVSRATMKALDISASRWTQPGGYLTPTLRGYVRSDRTPDLKAQHPQAWAQIEADFDRWAPATVAGSAALMVLPSPSTTSSPQHPRLADAAFETPPTAGHGRPAGGNGADAKPVALP